MDATNGTGIGIGVHASPARPATRLAEESKIAREIGMRARLNALDGAESNQKTDALLARSVARLRNHVYLAFWYDRRMTNPKRGGNRQSDRINRFANNYLWLNELY